MAGHLEIPMVPLGPNESITSFGKNDTQKNENANQDKGLLQRTPTPTYRHSSPSGPWPWMDFDEDIPTVTPPTDQPADSDFQNWDGYPQSLFPNWTEAQVKRCEMLTKCPTGDSNVMTVDVYGDGKFGEPNRDKATIQDQETIDGFWNWLKGTREDDIRVRAFFVKRMTKEVLQMLGTKYNVEPFFFSSSAHWIPSRFQESMIPGEGDHITIVLPFVRVREIDQKAAGPISSHSQTKEGESSSQEDAQIIDTQAPLYLHTCNKHVFQDLLSVHMVRGARTSTILSYHPEMREGTADQLHSLIHRTGDSVYWQKLFERSKDPTCLLLCFLWYAMYEWDELFETLYAHINTLETLLGSQDIRETRELHILQAHLLYYRTLLDDFRKSVTFVQETPNPAMDDPSMTPEDRRVSDDILKKETEYLLSEIDRLESQRLMQFMRLKNVIDLAFATVNIEDSQYMKELTVATVRDSAAMKRLSYLTMVFLPANFMSNLFSMNVVEINPQGAATLNHYIEAAIGLTAFAMWIVVALQAESIFVPQGSSIQRRVCWPLYYILDQGIQLYIRLYNRTIPPKQKTT
ncbi:hypothetical protein JVU11DRAFT_8235 [Chiua virens]|nr:hypothetical protein JVU11DRAFT_8235 [Chiua virens]